MSAPTVLYHTQNSWIAQLDPQIPAQSTDSCAMYGSTDCAAQSMDCADPQIAPNKYTFFSEAINFIRQCSKFHAVIKLSNFINSIKTIIEMNEFTIFLWTSTLKKYFLNSNILIYSNKYQGIFHPLNIVLHKLKIFIRQPHCQMWVATPPRHCRHYHNIAAITISKKCFTT